MTETPKLLSVVVPIYFEELVVEEFYRRTRAVLEALSDRYAYELIFVDDGSRDRSLELLVNIARADSRVTVLEFSRNFGHQMAITAGLEHARGDAVVLIDGDLQDPPEVISQMVDEWEKGIEVVYGVREERDGETAFKLLTARWFYALMGKLSDIAVPRDTGDFRLLDRKAVDALCSLPERERFIRGLVPWIGFSQKGIYYHRDARYAGETKYTLQKMLRFAVVGITSFSDKPLVIVTQVGILFSFFSFLLSIWLIINKLLYPENTLFGWTSLVVIILFVAGVQLTCTGIVGLYVGKIFHEVKQRPLYLVARTYNYTAQSAVRRSDQVSG